MKNTKEIIQNIINERELSHFKGMKEDFWFEAKSKNPYNLTSPIGRYELAKDVSAFANEDGGFIIIGLKTEPLVEENTDRVKAIDNFKLDKFDITKYIGIINENVFPKIKGIKIDLVEEKDKPKFGIGYIFIPVQNEDKKYFLIKNVVEEKKLIKGIVFGLIQRIGAKNIPKTVSQIHESIKKGKRPTTEKLERIEKKIDMIPQMMHQVTKQISKALPVVKLVERTKRLESEG